MRYRPSNILALSIVSIMAFSSAPLSYAAGACVIESAPSVELGAYLVNTETVLQGVLDKAVNTCPTDSLGSSADKLQSALVGTLNSSIGFSNFVTATRFYVMGLGTEVPPQLDRDHASLGRSLEQIRDAMTIVYERCSENTPIYENFLPSGYETKNKTAGNILRELLTNQVDMMNFYRATVLGDTIPDTSFILVGDSGTFKSDMVSHYGPGANGDYGQCLQKTSVFQDLKTAIKRISEEGSGIKAGMQEWKDASLLLENSNGQNDAEKRKNVFRLKLGAQGISLDFSQMVAANTMKYGSPDPLISVSSRIGSWGDIISQTVRTDTSYNSRSQEVQAAPTTDSRMQKSTELLDQQAINNEIR